MSQLPHHSSPSKPIPPASTQGPPNLSTLSEKRLRLARSLQLLQSDIRQAREGIETLETRLESIQTASTARQIDSDRRLTLRRINGDPPPIIQIPQPPVVKKTDVLLSSGTYVWLPFQRTWIIWILWIVLVLQGMLLVGLMKSRGAEERVWEPYSFGEWGRGVKWPT